MSTKVQIVVNGLAGPRCPVEASTTWTILQVQEAISTRIGVPVDWQRLLKGTEELSWEVTVASLISVDLETLELTLLVEEVPELEPGALRAAIKEQDERRVLQLLRRRQLPGLNQVEPDGRTLLHRALLRGFQEAARVLAAREDFREINAANQGGSTALHLAAYYGFLPVCEAIAARADFTELLSPDDCRCTALDWARAAGYQAIVELLENAEAAQRPAA